MHEEPVFSQSKWLELLFLGLFCVVNPSFSLSGKEIYQDYCHVCHASGLAGAPKFRSRDDWLSRCREKHLTGLVKSALHGINAMPAKGTCDRCDKNDIQAAIDYMVAQDEKSCH